MSRWTAERSSLSRLQVVGILGILLVAGSIGLLVGAAGGVTADVESAGHEATSHDDVVDLLEDDLEGDGTPDDPYRIHDVEELQAMNQNLSAHYELVADIDAGGETNFDPVGTSSDSFEGSLDGNGYTITGLTIDHPDEDNIGLFASLNGATIENVRLDDVHVTGNSFVGGLAGNVGTWSTISNVEVAGDVHGDGAVGGLVGQDSHGSNEITGSYTTGVVSGDSGWVGGLAGTSFSDISNSGSSADVVGGDDHVGGLVGLNTDGSTIENAYATGSVDGPDDHAVGGLVGTVFDDDDSIETSFAAGHVDADGADVGGLIGDRAAGAEVTNSYWDEATSGQDASDGGDPLTTAEMTGEVAATTMDGFDFDESWVLTAAYPELSVLLWEGVGTEDNPYLVDRGCGFELDEAGAVYELVSDLEGSETCLDITANGVTLDGSGYEIRGNDVSDQDLQYGVRVTGDDVTVENLHARHWNETGNAGIYVFHADGGTVSNVEVHDSDRSVRFVGSDDITVEDLSVTGGFRGISIEGGTHELTDVELSGNFVGMWWRGADGTTVTNLTATDNANAGVSVDSVNGGSLESVEITDNGYGVFVRDQFEVDADVAITDGVVSDNDDWDLYVEEGATLSGWHVGIGDSTAPETRLFFEAKNVSVSGIDAAPDHSDRVGIGRYFEAEQTGDNAYLDHWLLYYDEDLLGVDEETLSLWHHDGDEWNPVDGSSVDTSMNVVATNVTDFSTFGIFGEEAMGTLEGTVTEFSAGEPVEGATVEIEETGDEVSTAADGSYSFDAPVGNVTLVVSADGFLANETVVTVAEDGTVVDPILEYDLEGTGTEADPYRIHDVYELQAINQDRSANYTLANDVDASETQDWNDGDGFEPIGDEVDDDLGIRIILPDPDPSEGSFSGSFDGAGHTISSLTIDRQEEDYVGLFGIAEAATIGSVVLEDAFVKGDEHVGGIAGKLSYGELTDVETVDTYVRAYEGFYGGGLVGTLESGTIDSSHTDGQVRGSGDVIGGLVGTMEAASTPSLLQNSSSTADVDGGTQLGGAVGYVDSGSITGTYAEGDVIGDETESVKADVRIGGLVGDLRSGTVSQSYATGDVEGSTDVGGLVGHVRFSGEVTESYATGTVMGYVTDDSNHGGLIGQNDGDVTDSYWDFENSPALDQNDGVGFGDTVGVTGLSTDDMTGEAAEDNLLEFDFADTWTTTDSYPVLAWEVEGALTPYTDGDGIVGTDGLRDAIDDWRDGDVDTDLLRDVIDAWRSGDSVS